MLRIIHFAAIGVTGFGLLFCIIACATNNWFEMSGYAPGLGNIDANSGLWKGCGGGVCLSIDPASDKLKAVRAFTILAILAFAGALASVLLGLKKSMFLIIHLLLAAGAAFCQLVAMAIYTDMNRKASESSIANFGWSFALGWIGLVLALISAALSVFLKIRGGGDE